MFLPLAVLIARPDASNSRARSTTVYHAVSCSSQISPIGAAAMANHTILECAPRTAPTLLDHARHRKARTYGTHSSASAAPRSAALVLIASPSPSLGIPGGVCLSHHHCHVIQGMSYDSSVLDGKTTITHGEIIGRVAGVHAWLEQEIMFLCPMYICFML